MSAEGVNLVRLDAGEWLVMMQLCEKAVADPDSGDLTRKVAARLIESLNATQDVREVLQQTREALHDLWGCIGSAEIAHLQPETVQIASQIHQDLCHSESHDEGFL